MILVDDEEYSRSELRYILESQPGCQVVGEAQDAAQALLLIQKLKPDAVFLDVQMPGMTGEKLAQALAEQGQDAPLLVFATAYEDYALNAFAVRAVDYLLKPFDPERVKAALQRIQEHPRWRRQVPPPDSGVDVGKLPVWCRGRLHLLDYGQIIYAAAWEGSVRVVAAGGEYQFSGTLQQLEQRLHGKGPFLRVHKSFLANLGHASEVIPWFKGTFRLRMDDPGHTEIPVSRQMVSTLRQALGL